MTHIYIDFYFDYNQGLKNYERTMKLEHYWSLEKSVNIGSTYPMCALVDHLNSSKQGKYKLVILKCCLKLVMTFDWYYFCTN